MNGTKFLHIDIMMGERFVCTLHYKYCPAFNIRYNDLKKFIEEKRPSLKGKEYTIEFDA